VNDSFKPQPRSCGWKQTTFWPCRKSNLVYPDLSLIAVLTENLFPSGFLRLKLSSYILNFTSWNVDRKNLYEVQKWQYTPKIMFVFFLSCSHKRCIGRCPVPTEPPEVPTALCTWRIANCTCRPQQSHLSTTTGTRYPRYYVCDVTFVSLSSGNQQLPWAMHLCT
jgi:hypothetical protein